MNSWFIQFILSLILSECTGRAEFSYFGAKTPLWKSEFSVMGCTGTNSLTVAYIFSELTMDLFKSVVYAVVVELASENSLGTNGFDPA